MGVKAFEWPANDAHGASPNFNSPSRQSYRCTAPNRTNPIPNAHLSAMTDCTAGSDQQPSAFAVVRERTPGFVLWRRFGAVDTIRTLVRQWHDRRPQTSLAEKMVRVVGLEPTLLSELDFESSASTSFTTPANTNSLISQRSHAAPRQKPKERELRSGILLTYGNTSVLRYVRKVDAT